MKEKNDTSYGFGRLLSEKDLKAYTGLGRDSVRKLGQNASAIVRIGSRVLYDRKKIDTWLDSQAQDR